MEWHHGLACNGAVGSLRGSAGSSPALGQRTRGPHGAEMMAAPTVLQQTSSFCGGSSSSRALPGGKSAPPCAEGVPHCGGGGEAGRLSAAAGLAALGVLAARSGRRGSRGHNERKSCGRQRQPSLRLTPARTSVRRASLGSIIDKVAEDDEDDSDWDDEDEEDWDEDEDEEIGFFEDFADLQKEVAATKKRYDKSLSDAKAVGHLPVLLPASMKFIFPPGCAVDGAETNDGNSEEEGPEMFEGNFVDCTFGRGGHSREILSRISPTSKLFAFDIDPTAVTVARSLEKQDKRFNFINRPFAEMSEALDDVPIHGVMIDPGISSPQLDDNNRGFNLSRLSERPDSPLDLRMNPSVGMSAAEWLETRTVEELAWVLQNYGDQKCAHHPVIAERIAQAILDDQQLCGPYFSMQRFAEVAGRARHSIYHEDGEFEHSQRGMDHSAKLILQAIRMYLNQELEQLETGLASAFDHLVVGGRCIVATFKQPEQRVVYDFLFDHEEPDTATLKAHKARRLRELYPLLGTDLDYSVSMVGGPLRPSPSEVANNARARSSCLFVLEKTPRLAKRVKSKPRSLKARFAAPPLPDLI
eukprot:TRINITY_DN54324_c0_g1_i2.p1 TRINITY_DN54324_c0_g1~~TRINITY_DN54324_c0_g1_i2.p1  ORF type:complete len:584 (-),score=137.32 TRINITY_DN54324_c0_g1_i2:42-1793(-)